MILAYTKCVIIKNFQNRYFVLCTIISPACIQFQNLAKQTKVHCKYFFSIIALFYMWVQNYVLYDVYWLLFVSQSSLLVLLLLYIYFWVNNEVETCFTLVHVVFWCSSHCGVFSRQMNKSTSKFSSQNISGKVCNFFKWGRKVTPNFP